MNERPLKYSKQQLRAYSRSRRANNKPKLPSCIDRNETRKHNKHSRQHKHHKHNHHHKEEPKPEWADIDMEFEENFDFTNKVLDRKADLVAFGFDDMVEEQQPEKNQQEPEAKPLPAFMRPLEDEQPQEFAHHKPLQRFDLSADPSVKFASAQPPADPAIKFASSRPPADPAIQFVSAMPPADPAIQFVSARPPTERFGQREPSDRDQSRFMFGQASREQEERPEKSRFGFAFDDPSSQGSMSRFAFAESSPKGPKVSLDGLFSAAQHSEQDLPPMPMSRTDDPAESAEPAYVKSYMRMGKGPPSSQQDQNVDLRNLFGSNSIQYQDQVPAMPSGVTSIEELEKRHV